MEHALNHIFDDCQISGDHFEAHVGGENIHGVIGRAESGDAIEAMNVLGRLFDEFDDDIVVVISAPRISPYLDATIEKLVRSLRPEQGWGYVDHDGRARVIVPTLGLDLRYSPPRTTEVQTPSAVRNTTLFTDLNQWLLKVMILNGSPPDMWSKPRLAITGPLSLSSEHWVGVSQAKAYQFAHTLQQAGFLSWKRGRFELLDLRQLLLDWIDFSRLEQPYRTPVRSVLEENLNSVLKRAKSSVAASGHLASQAYGLTHSNSTTEEVYVFEDLGVVLKSAALEETSVNQADFLLTKPLGSSVRRGVQVVNDTRIVDPIQLALDASRRRDRGREQAEHIVEVILSWHAHE